MTFLGTDRPAPTDETLPIFELLYPAWMADAACKGQPVDVFYPQRGADVALALAFCKACPVLDDCRAYALDLPMMRDFGIIGGMTPRERTEARRTRRLGGVLLVCARPDCGTRFGPFSDDDRFCSRRCRSTEATRAYRQRGQRGLT